MASSGKTTSRLLAGAAKVDVTPPADTHLAGTCGILRGAEVVLERLYARAVVFEQDGFKTCIVAPDLGILTARWGNAIRKAIASECNMSEEAVIVAFPQIHSVPPVGNFILDEDLQGIPEEHEYLRGSQRAFCEFAVDRMVEAAVKADQSRVPVKLAVGRAVRDDLCFNRRGVRRDGTVGMPWFYSSASNPLGPTDVAYMEGPVDPEVGFAAFKNDAGNCVAAMLYFTCHPVNIFATATHAVSSDWPGAWAAGVESLLGEGCTALVLNGCCGNINPWPPFTPDFVPDHRRMGRELTRSVEAILKTLQFEDCSGLALSRRVLSLDLRQLSAKDKQDAERILQENPSPLWQKQNPKQVEWSWMEAAMIMSLELERKRSPNYAYEIQALRVGPLGFVAQPGEPFVEQQLSIKQASPFPYTWVGHCCNDYAGYMAPVSSYSRIGLETPAKPTKISRLAPGCTEKVADEAVHMLKDLFK